MYSAGRPSARLALAAAAVVFAAATTGAVVSVRHGHRPIRPSVTAATAPAQASAAAGFYGAVKVAMVPLLRHVQTMGSFLAQVNDHPDPSPAVGALASVWAEDMATARDLVGRLIPYPGADGRAARAVFENGAALYRESALALTRLPDEPTASGRLRIVRSAARLRLLADRTFDLGKRIVLALADGEDGSRLARILPAPVPAFAAAGDPCAVPVSIESSTPQATDDHSGIDWHRWISQHQTTLTAAVHILDAPAEPADVRAASARLGDTKPEPASAGQGTVAVRLALLIDAEAACASPAPGTTDDRTINQQQRLRVIGDDLWSVGARLVVHGGHRWPEGLYPRPMELDPSALRTGGLFGGHPPALRPGDPPDIGVPGGLQLPDPLQVLGGA